MPEEFVVEMLPVEEQNKIFTDQNTKLSTLLRMCLADLLYLREQPGFGVDMTSWVKYSADQKKCLVCLAGAGMVGANTGCELIESSEARIKFDLGNMPREIKNLVSRRSQAINYIRVGSFHAAFEYFYDNLFNNATVYDAIQSCNKIYTDYRKIQFGAAGEPGDWLGRELSYDLYYRASFHEGMNKIADELGEFGF